MRFMIATALVVSAVPAAALAQTVPAPTTAPAAAAAGYSVEDTDIGTLLDDPAAKAVLDKHIPGFSTKDQIDMARSMTLKGIQQYAPDMVTDKVLSDIQVDLSKLPVKK
jgi:hypothetical protein